MKTKEKINVVLNLVKGLNFGKTESDALLQAIKKELYGANYDETSSVEPVVRLEFPLLYRDGSILNYLRMGDNPEALVIMGDNGKRFGLCISHVPANDLSVAEAFRLAKYHPKIGGKSWRILTTSECRSIARRFYAVNSTLAKLNCRRIVHSNQIGVLVSDDAMHGATGWQVWFAIDID